MGKGQRAKPGAEVIASLGSMTGSLKHSGRAGSVRLGMERGEQEKGKAAGNCSR